jgi:hypothetical protein
VGVDETRQHHQAIRINDVDIFTDRQVTTYGLNPVAEDLYVSPQQGLGRDKRPTSNQQP